MSLAIATLFAIGAAESAELKKLTFKNLQGWSDDAHEEAYAAFLKSCSFILSEEKSLRPARPLDNALVDICRKASGLGVLNREKARAFFETEFEPWLIESEGQTGLLTGYYEPEFEGSLEPGGDYKVPLLARPDDLETIPEGETRLGIEPELRGARRVGSNFEPYPDRAAIEAGILGQVAKPIVYLKRPSEAFIIHVQGSARIRLADHSVIRVAYAGRNGQPYTSIGRLLIERGAIVPEEMSLERLMGWLDAHESEAKALMQQNKSYIFFRIADELAPEDGPIGGAGTPLVPMRSLAVDRRFWSYGLPFWLEGVLPVNSLETKPLQQLMIAQDTGSAILGAARGDFFFGSGQGAGTLAGLMRHQTRFIVLQPQGWQPPVTGQRAEQP